MLDVVLLGAPGAGKGTQAELLMRWLSLPSVSSGALFRSNMEARTELGLEAKTYIDRGDLVPDNVTVVMVAKRIARDDCARGVIFDGFPRTLAQARALDAILEGLSRGVSIVPYISVSQSVLLARLAGRWTCRDCEATFHEDGGLAVAKRLCELCGGTLYQRDDDKPETQRRRITVYLERTAPLLSFYDERGLLAEVEGDQGIEEVQQDLRNVIKRVMT